MCNYPLKALSKDKKETVVFTISDGPCKLEDNLFFLSRRPGTPILRYDSILRGCDIPGVFEGDLFYYGGDEYRLKYQRGFVAVNSKKQVLTLGDVSKYESHANIYERSDIEIPLVQTYTFRYNDLYFTIEDILGEDNGDIVLMSRGGMKVPSLEVQQSAYLTYAGKRLYFGDEVEGSTLILKNGRCSINKDNQFMDITGGVIKNYDND